MNNDVLEYLNNDYLLHISIFEVLKNNNYQIYYQDKDGILLFDRISNCYFLSINNLELGIKLLKKINYKMIFLHQKFMYDYIKEKEKNTFKEELICFQEVYEKKEKVKIAHNLEIKNLILNDLDIVVNNYDKLSKDDLKKIIKLNNLFGGYLNNKLVGFIGIHFEGSIGLLRIFKEYQGLGYAKELEGYMINYQLERKKTPFCQIEVDNYKSLNLQKSLGYTKSNDKIYWLFK